MTLHQRIKALAKGAELAVQDLRVLSSCTVRFGRGRDGQPSTFINFFESPHRVFAPPVYGDDCAHIVELRDQITFDMRQDEAVPGGIFLCAYYDGFSYDLRPVLFGVDPKGATVGHASAMVGQEWLPAKRFRVLGRVVYQGFRTGDPLGGGCLSDSQGIRYDIAATMDLIGDVRQAQRDNAEKIAAADELKERLFPVAA